MEKLRIYGVKDTTGGYDELTKRQEHIATVFVDKDKKIVVEAKDPKVKEDLIEAIYWRGKDEVPAFMLRGGPPTEELREKERKEGTKSMWVTGVKPGDPDFLVGLFYGVERTQPTEGGWKKLGDYYVWSHDIVEE